MELKNDFSKIGFAQKIEPDNSQPDPDCPDNLDPDRGARKSGSERPNAHFFNCLNVH